MSLLPWYEDPDTFIPEPERRRSYARLVLAITVRVPRSGRGLGAPSTRGGLSLARGTARGADTKVVRARYTPVARGGLARARASARYVSIRPGEGRTTERTAFSPTEDGLSRTEVDRRLVEWAREHPRGYVYRLVLAPGEGRGHSEEALREWTRSVMATLQERHPEVQWVAWAHTDHSAHDHVHVLAITDHRLDREDLAELRYAAGAAWRALGMESRRHLDTQPNRGHDLEW